MTVARRTSDFLGRWGDRLLERFVPHASAAAAIKVQCFCECHYRCYKMCDGGIGQPVFCGPCNICETTSMCGSC